MTRTVNTFIMPEYPGMVRSDLILAAKTNSNLSGMVREDSESLKKDFEATANFLFAEGLTTQGFFLLDEAKRLG